MTAVVARGLDVFQNLPLYSYLLCSVIDSPAFIEPGLPEFLLGEECGWRELRVLIHSDDPADD
ncbi:MAG: hypothetical protein Q8L20_11070 [Gammaproteobacteria bacterium]|nr:hypothetical protein [Gammaproteobacteria bacterium]